jgi:hypothetical protein
VISIQAVLYELPRWVQHIEDDVGIGLVTRREDHYLVAFIRFPQTFQSVRPNVDTRFYSLSIRESHRNIFVAGVSLDIVDAVDESLVQIKDNRFLDVLKLEVR